MTVRIEGMEAVLRNLNSAIDGIENRTLAGLLEAGLLVQRTSQERVPVEFGNLRASAYTRKAQSNSKAVEIGYSANYALFVHENMEQKLKGKPRPPKGKSKKGLGVYWGPKGQPKFLESALRDKTPEMLDIIKRRARVSQRDDKGASK